MSSSNRDAPGPSRRPPLHPVNRRGGYQPNTRAVPAPTSREERTERMQALRNQLRYPHALVDSTLRYHLNRTNWDVNRAAEDFWQQEQAPGPLTPQPRHRRGRTVEQGRLRMVHDMQRGLENTGNATLRTSNAEMMLLYNQHNFAPDAAEADIAFRNGDYDDITDHLATLRTPPDGQATLDERLALFISITSTNNVVSARQFLQRHDWDLAVAIDDWVSLGKLPIVHSPQAALTGMRAVNANQPRRVLQGQFVQDDEEPNKDGAQAQEEEELSDVEWAHDEVLPEELRGLPETLADQRPVEGRDYIVGERDVGRRGWLIDEDRSPAAVNAPDATKLRVEVIKNGRYRCFWFEGQQQPPGATRSFPFRWDDTDRPTMIEIEFDWHDREHIKKLNKWRYQLFVKLTGERVREVGDKFNKYEMDWLREQEAILTEEKFYNLAGQQAGGAGIASPAEYASALESFSRGDSFPLPLSAAEADDLVRRFNATFAGKTTYRKRIVRLDGTKQFVEKDMSLVGKVPRPERTSAMLRQQRHRIRSLCKQFMVKHEHSTDTSNQNELESESDSDFEQAQDDQNSNSQGPDCAPM